MSKQTRHATYNINYHLVWCPKYRRPVLAGNVGARLAELLPEYVQELDGEVLDLVVMPDHVHLFASFPPTLAISQMKDLSVRVHRCPDCGYTADRDVNAAQNILSLAVKSARTGPPGANVSRWAVRSLGSSPL